MPSAAEFSNLASVVYKRTYSRNKSDGSKESWNDTVDRVVRGNTQGFNVSAEEKDRLAHFIRTRKALPGGRGLWMSGANVPKLGGQGQVNCWFLTAEKWLHFVYAMDFLMTGGGVGMSVEHRFVSKLPKIKVGVTVRHEPTKDADFIVPDSREGWCQLVSKVFEAYFETGRSFTYSTVCVRQYGEAIKGFGGTASGPFPLIQCVENLCRVLKSREGKALRPIDAGDLITCIGEMVVSGNVRRSAIILLGDPWDREYLQAKDWSKGNIPNNRAFANYSVVASCYDDLHPLFWKTYENGEPFGIFNRENAQTYGRIGEPRPDKCLGVNPCLSLNTVVKKPEGLRTIGDLQVGDKIWSGKEWTTVLKIWCTGTKPVYRYKTFGGSFLGTSNHRVLSGGKKVEVGDTRYIDGADGKSYLIHEIDYVGLEDVYDITVDCPEHVFWSDGLLVSNCGEVPLENGEPCNIGTVHLQNVTDLGEAVEAGRHMFRYMKRVTLLDYPNPVSEEVIRRNMRVGLSLTGCLASPLFNPHNLDYLYQNIQLENVLYSKELGVRQSIRTTTIKPEGTGSKVGDAMGLEGIHPGFSRYAIQRIRIAANDPLIPLLKKAGHYMEPVVKFDGSLDHGTLVVDFYQATPPGAPVADEDWDTWKQLDVLKMVQRYWSDNSVSVTVYYKREDIPRIKEWVRDNLSEIKSISFLCHSDHGFKQAPKEAITKQHYDKLQSKIKPIDTDAIGGDTILEGLECEAGVCPVR